MPLIKEVLSQKITKLYTKPHPASAREAASRWADSIVAYWNTGTILSYPAISINASNCSVVLKNKLVSVFRNKFDGNLATINFCKALFDSVIFLQTTGAITLTVSAPPAAILRSQLGSLFTTPLSPSTAARLVTEKIEVYTKQINLSGTIPTVPPTPFTGNIA